MARAFISYTRRPADVGPVEAIRATLEGFGVEAWLDSRSLVAGDDYRVKIEEAISSADALFLAASAESLTSDYVMRETRLARQLGKPILPFLLDDIPFERAPEHLRDLHAEPLFRRPRANWPSVLWEVCLRHGLTLRGQAPAASVVPPAPYARPFRPTYQELRGDYRMARAHLEEALRALKYDNASGWTVLNLALLYLNIGDLQNAVPTAARAVAMLPQAGEAHYVAALVMSAQEPVTTLPLDVARQILFRLETARSYGFDDPIVDVLTVVVGHERFQRHALIVPDQVKSAMTRLSTRASMNWDEYLRARDLLRGLDVRLVAMLPEPVSTR